jgi:DNA-binding CsgD family transcriptional regulator
MPRLANVDWIIITDLIYKLNTAQTNRELRQEFLDNIHHAFAFDCASFFTAADFKEKMPDPVGYNLTMDIKKAYAEVKEEDHLAWAYNLNESIVISDEDFLSDDDRRTHFFQSMNLREDWRYGLNLCLYYDGEFLGIAAFHNYPESGDFPARAADILDVIKPHLALALYRLTRDSKQVLTEKLPNSERLLYEYTLTHREVETLKLILSGIPTNEICDLLSISPNTLKNHLQNIYRKLDVHNRIELVQKVMGMV